MSNFRLTKGFYKTMNNSSYLKDRDLSILNFNSRVLSLAYDENTPLLERINFTKIVFHNLDEFISVKLPKIKSPEYQIAINYITSLYKEMSNLLSELLGEYKTECSPNYLITPKHEPVSESKFNGVKDGRVYYVTVDSTNKFNMYNYTAKSIDEMDEIIAVTHPNRTIKMSFLVRFISDKTFKYIYTGESINKIVEEMKDVVEIKSDVIYNYFQSTCTSDIIIQGFLRSIDIPIRDINYFTVSEDLINIDNVNLKPRLPNLSGLVYPQYTPAYKERDYYNTLLNNDVVVYNPYTSYNEVSDFISQMCIDERIDSVFITLYRTASESRIIDSLIKARKLNKNVYVYIEPTARGNEEANLKLIKKLSDADINLVCSYFGYKVHSKLFLAVDNRGKIFTHIGTGNYNEKTSKIYTDIHLLTSNHNIGKTALSLFKSIFAKSDGPGGLCSEDSKCYNKELYIAPFTMRCQINALIDREIKKGSAGKIRMKCNSLCDAQIIQRLYEASYSGVDVKLLIRTSIGLIPANDNIEIRSKVGRFLEHDRIYIFGDDVYIGSADILLRNLDKRVELMCHISDTNASDYIKKIFYINWNTEKIFKYR